MGMTCDRRVHSSVTQTGCFRGVLSWVTPFPVVGAARTANKTGEQAELSLEELFPGRGSHLFVFVPQLPAQRPSLAAVPGRAAVPQGSVGASQRMLQNSGVLPAQPRQVIGEMKKGMQRIKGIKNFFP